MIKWLALMTNLLPLGVAELWWSGEEPYTLHASDCVTARSEQLDAPDKPEARVRPPATFASAFTLPFRLRCVGRDSAPPAYVSRIQLSVSLPGFLDFKLFGKTILVVNRKIELSLAHQLRK